MKSFVKFSIPFFIFILFSFQFPLVVRAEISSVPVKADSISAIKKQARTDNLAEIKVQACVAREANIKNRSDQMAKRAANMEDVFSKIEQRVEEFYQTKLVSQGKTVANYNALVADVTAKSTALTPLIAKAQSDAVSFSCDKDKPADQVLQFNQDMKAVISALETFKKSVVNLIVGVKSVTGTENNATNSAKSVTQ